MASWDREIDLGVRTWALAAGLLSAAILAWITLLGVRARSEPLRCSQGFVALEGRCCALGQGIAAGACIGAPEKCPPGYESVIDPAPGCVLTPLKVTMMGGQVTLGPTDWDSLAVVERQTLTVSSFMIDRAEVDHHRYTKCVLAELCEPLGEALEPGVPVTGVSLQGARDFCAYSGGRLPTPQEWIFAAAGEQARRYPWGPHGLVCRRAAFGMASGPCSSQAKSPEISGARPEGATPEGLVDLAGNVAELTVDTQGTIRFHGGSYRSRAARELKTWSHQQGLIADDTGFRCVYPIETSR